MLEELEALVAFAHTGSMGRAAHNLNLTPSALTRRIQRLESELAAVLIDRHFKPPKLTQAGLEVLERSRMVLSSLSDLKASLSGITAPAGALRLGLSHALAQPEVSKAIIVLGQRFPLLQPRIVSQTSCELMACLRAGELDAALVVFPVGMALPDDLEGTILWEEKVRLVQARSATPRRRLKPPEFYRQRWVLNPRGCLIRTEIEHRVERLGAPLAVAAELHSPDLQFELICGHVGVGALRDSFVRRHPARLSVIEHPDFRISIHVAFLRGRYLGGRGRAVHEFQAILTRHLGSMYTRP